MTELTSAVREAQADADRRFGDGPVQPWEPPPVLSESTRRRLAVVAAASLLATALLVAIAVAKTAPAVEVAPAQRYQPASATTTDDDVPEEEAPPPAPSTTLRAPSLALGRRGAEWHLSAQGAARHDVVQRLAEASGSTLHGSPDAVVSARPVQLQWRGRSLAQLWPLVLAPELNFALQCRRDRCDVWILGASRAAPASIAPLLPSPAIEPPALAMPIPMPDQDDAPVRD
jgi:hypothetical protein